MFLRCRRCIISHEIRSTDKKNQALVNVEFHHTQFNQQTSNSTICAWRHTQLNQQMSLRPNMLKGTLFPPIQVLRLEMVAWNHTRILILLRSPRTIWNNTASASSMWPLLGGCARIDGRFGGSPASNRQPLGMHRSESLLAFPALPGTCKY